MELLQDLRYAARSLKREPAFFSVVLLLFALSIGASTIVFSVVDAVVVRQLPYADSERIVGVSETFSYPGYKDWLDMNNAFEAIGIYRTDRYAVTGQREPELITGAAVTHGVFAALRTDPILGRTILPGDDEIGGPQLAVLSDGLWKRRFGSDSTVLGRSIQLNEEHHTIVGVMPPGFKFPNDVQLWATFSDERRQGARDWSFAHALARLKSGTTIDGAQREMEILAARLEESMPPDSRSRKPEFRVVRFKEMVVGEVRSAMFLLLGAVGAALLISCVNIANLLLVKAVERSREVAIRVSIGAARWWLVSSHPETGNMERCEA